MMDDYFILSVYSKQRKMIQYLALATEGKVNDTILPADIIKFLPDPPLSLFAYIIGSADVKVPSKSRDPHTKCSSFLDAMKQNHINSQQQSSFRFDDNVVEGLQAEIIITRLAMQSYFTLNTIIDTFLFE